MAFEKLLEEYKQKTDEVLAMGGPEKLAKRKAEGHLNARERIDYLIDEGSFIESGRFARSNQPAVKHKTPADGKVAGFAKIDGRDIALVSNDFTVLGASSAVINMKKIKHVKQVANKRGMPMVMLGESSGARMPDRMGSAGRAIIAQDPFEYQRLRESPWCSALLGQCYGSSTWYSAMSDFVVRRKGAIMAIASPTVTSLAINKPIEAEDLGGWKLLTGVSGLADMAVDTDQQAMDAIKTIGANVVTISAQDTASKRQFCAKESLTHTLLSDTDGAVINAYRVLRDGGDPAKPIAKRITFYVNPDGRIVAVDTKIKPATAAEDSLAILELLGAKKDEK